MPQVEHDAWQISRHVVEMKEAPKLPAALHADLRQIFAPCFSYNALKRPSSSQILAQCTSLCDLIEIKRHAAPASRVLEDMHTYLQVTSMNLSGYC